MSYSQTRALPPSPIPHDQIKWLFATTCLVAAYCLALPSAAHAGMQDIESANNQVSAQFQRSSVNYTETTNEPGGNEVLLDNENGGIDGYGITGSVMKNLWLGNDYLHAHYDSVSGNTNYTGGTLANPAFGSATGESGARIRDYSIRYGAGFPQDRETMLTLYTELGHHKYLRTLGLGTPGAYRETYSHNYFGIGALMQYSSMDKWVFSLNALLGHTFQSRMDAVFPAPFNGLSAGLGDSSLERLGFQVDYAMTKHLHTNVSIELTAWSYGASTSQPVAAGINLYEPNSTTFITTARVGIGYAF
jgi:hypothetical protein